MSSGTGSGGGNRNGSGQPQQQQPYRGGRGGGRGGYRGGNNNNGGGNYGGGGRGGYAGSSAPVTNDVASKGKWGNGPPASLKSTDSRPSSALSQNGPAPAQSSPQNEQLDRIYFLLMHMVGTKVTAVIKGNLQYEGILHTATASPDLGIALGLARQIIDGKPAPHVITSLIILPKDLVSLSVSGLEIAEVKPESGNKGGFQTDSAIGARVGEFGRERELVQWTTDNVDDTMNLENGLTGEKWDQFATNESLFGVQTDFKEEMYTTVIDKSDPNFKRKEAEAARLAREIEAGFGNTDNAHLLEERNISTGNEDVNEEDKYSSVLRKSDKPENAYVPPGARARTTGAATSSSATKKPEIAVATSTVKKDTEKYQALQTAPASTKPMAIPEPVSQRSKSPTSQRAKSPSPNRAPAGASGSRSSSGRVSPGAGKLGTSASGQTEQKSAPSAAAKSSTDRRVESILTAFDRTSAMDLNTCDPVGDTLQQFQKFSEKEKRGLGQPKKVLHAMTKPKPEMFNELRAFSASFKLPMPCPPDLKDVIKKGLDEVAVEGPASVTQKPRPASYATDRSVSEIAAPSPSSSNTAAPDNAAAGEKEKDKSKFKFNLAAVEFTPSFGSGGASPNSQSQGLPSHEKQRSGSIAGGAPKHPARNNSGGYNKGYQKGYNYQQQNFRPPYGQPYEDGSYPPPMDPSQQFYYPVPGAPYPGHFRPMRPGFVPAGMPQPMMGPGGVPYMMPYPVPPGAMVPQMMGAPPMAGVPMYVRPGGPGGPGGPPPPQQQQQQPAQTTSKNGPPTPTSAPSQIQGGQAPSPNAAANAQIMYRPPPHGGEGYSSPQNRPPYMVPQPGAPPHDPYQAAMMGYPPHGYYPGHPGMMMPMVWTGDPMQMAEMQQHMMAQGQIPMHMQHHQQQQQQQHPHEMGDDGSLQGEGGEEVEVGEDDANVEGDEEVQDS
ncbi:hypothetical protein BDR26DRAFT_936900 [Obelidium mucronatum]|nr:hypothetical protein BDR26DRAFT_936900 [Obelidium mucronatum]